MWLLCILSVIPAVWAYFYASKKKKDQKLSVEKDQKLSVAKKDQKLCVEDYVDASRVDNVEDDVSHVQIGKEQQLFFFDAEYSAGSCFWLPHGSRLYLRLQSFMRDEYKERGYDEVISPNIYSLKLWKKSGHLGKYKEDMFLFDRNSHASKKSDMFGLKPMNCPGHCCMFKQLGKVSYEKLPLRMADFGALHRNELSGALSGLSRVRRFCQDDSHIFCRRSQIKDEILNVLEFVKSVYSIFGFRFSLALSSRPEKSIGSDDLWEQAEENLRGVLNDFCEQNPQVDPWEENPGDGAFYGPKIDIYLLDSKKRKFQMATIQLDFQLPSKERFNLKCIDENGKPERVVMIHRAVLGSIERFISILLEHCNGRLPFWLSPRQVKIIAIEGNSNDDSVKHYAEEVRSALHARDLFVDLSVVKKNKRRSSKYKKLLLEKFSVFLFIGEREMKSKSVSIRVRQSDLGVHPLENCVAFLKDLVDQKV